MNIICDCDPNQKQHPLLETSIIQTDVCYISWRLYVDSWIVFTTINTTLHNSHKNKNSNANSISQYFIMECGILSILISDAATIQIKKKFLTEKNTHNQLIIIIKELTRLFVVFFFMHTEILLTLFISHQSMKNLHNI